MGKEINKYLGVYHHMTIFNKATKLSALALALTVSATGYTQASPSTTPTVIKPGDRGYIKHMNEKYRKEYDIDNLKSARQSAKDAFDKAKESKDKDAIQKARDAHKAKREQLQKAQNAKFDGMTNERKKNRAALDKKNIYDGPRVGADDKNFIKQERSDRYKKRKDQNAKIQELRQKKHDAKLAARERMEKLRTEHKANIDNMKARGASKDELKKLSRKIIVH